MDLLHLRHSFSCSSLMSMSPLRECNIPRISKCEQLRRQPFRSSRFKASWQELTGVLMLSAIPFAAVKAIANSSVGESLRTQLLERKKVELLNSSKLRQLSQLARKDSMWYGEGRPRWLGPVPFDYPAYLTGELPGDYGFDVVGLSKDPSAFRKYFNYEVLHSRWAMLAALGALVPEVLDLSGAFHFVESVWWRVGYSKLKKVRKFIAQSCLLHITYEIFMDVGNT